MIAAILTQLEDVRQRDDDDRSARCPSCGQLALVVHHYDDDGLILAFCFAEGRRIDLATIGVVRP